ncbi:MAG TPA: CPBP family intramembrane glutamic endopeptidase [Aggregatilineales bacterium]|nr:CPBP family intramembrane glutamic endopeptidase [Aggregatilineales bacterium]
MESTPEPRPRLHPNRLVIPGFLLGLFMILLGVFITGVLRSENLRREWYPTQNTNPFTEILLGIGAGLLGILLVWTLEKFIAPLRGLREILKKTLIFEEVRIWHALAFGLLAGIPEEILFRGAVQPILGIIITSILFGVLHAISRTYAVYATTAGFYLGMLAMWRGDIWAATAAHFAYDAGIFLLMGFLARRESGIMKPE